MSSLLHGWLSLFGISLFLLKDCKSLFLRHTETGKCIKASEELAYKNPEHAFSYLIKMTYDCLDRKAQFRFLDSQLLHNIEKNGTLASPVVTSRAVDKYLGRLVVYQGISDGGKTAQKLQIHRLKQTAGGSLVLYKRRHPLCVEPNSSKYLIRKTFCDTTKQKFTFGSVTAYGAKMKNTHCSPIQHMMVKMAQYGDFDTSGKFNQNANIDTQCSKLANCRLKSLCDGQRSCELTMDNNLLSSKYCSDTSKQIYTKYTCVDTYNSSAITAAPNVRLTNQNTGYIEIKNGSVWRKVYEENWDKEHQKMMCHHLGFEATESKIESRQLERKQQIFTGNLIYDTQLSRKSSCIHLKPSKSTQNTKIPYVKCKVCDNPLLYNEDGFPDSVFTGSGDSRNKYKDARITKGGWCPSNYTTAYLQLDLQKEHHIKQVVVMADKEQTQWSGSYSLEYSRDPFLYNSLQILGNQNGYQASRTNLDIHNVRYVRIQSTGHKSFCLRIELCEKSKLSKDESGIGITGVVASATAAALVFAIVLVVVVFFFRRRKRLKEHDNKDIGLEERKTEENNDEQMNDFDTKPDDPIVDGNNTHIYLNTCGDVKEKQKSHPPVSIAEFSHYVQELKANDNCEFQKQYDDLPTNAKGSWEVAKKPFNKKKNRYANIVSYDYCRVVLSGDENQDYINASYIDGIEKNSYIASQGPNEFTVDDMWRMVWEQRSSSIVMVTSLIELGKPKCEKYWPDEGTRKYGDIEVTLVMMEAFADHVTRTFQLEKDSEEREVKHYHFKSWPDHGVPQYSTQLLAFRRHFRTHHLEQSGPIVIHCSAGIGRTGVFLAIDTILDKLEKGVINSVNVFGEVCAMRERRMNMVQTLEQYIFIHEAILETIIYGINEVDSCKIQEQVEQLAETKASGMTGFQEKFKALREVSPRRSPEECTAALLEGNSMKNRNENICPAESCRVPLQYIDGVKNSDYINAVFVHGYLERNYFIATQSPLSNTINDFWRLVHSQKSSTIVLLNVVKDGTTFPKFWPTYRGIPTQYGSLTVQLDSEQESDAIWTRKFILSPYPDLSESQVVNIFHYTKWPNHRVPPNACGVVNFMSLVEDSRKNHGLGPIIVVCSDGAGRTGTYIAISNLLERVKIEHAIDVFQSIKLIRGARPQFVENVEQYQFCYTAIIAFLDAFKEDSNFH